jgi:hypothetical protein
MNEEQYAGYEERIWTLQDRTSVSKPFPAPIKSKY